MDRPALTHEDRIAALERVVDDLLALTMRLTALVTDQEADIQRMKRDGVF